MGGRARRGAAERLRRCRGGSRLAARAPAACDDVSVSVVAILATDQNDKIDPKLAANPLINPPQSVLDNVKSWPELSDKQTQEFNKMYAAVTGG